MTGAEVLIKKGRVYCLGKVRFDGQTTPKWFTKKIFKYEFKDIWPQYIKQRRKGMSLFSKKSEIITAFDDGYFFTVPKGFSVKVTDRETFENLLCFLIHPEIEWAVQQKGIYKETDGYMCTYSDYVVYVDYDKQEIKKW